MDGARPARTAEPSDLFRPEVIERQIDRLHGDVLVLPRLSHALILSLLLAWVTAASSWLITSTYARKETVLGWLEPPEGVTRIYAEDNGIVREVRVREGDLVEAGQSLLVITGDRYLEDGARLDQQLLEEYEAQQRMLRAQLDRTATIYQRRGDDIEQRTSAARRDLELLGVQLGTLGQRQQLVAEQVERLQALQRKGLIATADLEQTLAQELALRNERQGMLREQTNRRNAIEQLQTEAALLPEQRDNDLVQLQTRLSDVAQKIAQLAGQRSYLIKAARDGQVNNLQIRPGERVHAGSSVPLLTLIPGDAELAAQVLIPVRSAGFVGPGQSLDIRYDAFPYQKFGLYRGEVTNLSETVLLPNELAFLPLRLEEPVYRVTARLDRQAVRAYGKDFALKPGMTLSADVRLGERTLLQWLLEPIYSLKGRR
ncbi:MAG: HlyD family efflux transporter periplasmic adaptor subunit [Gammaproteobacteria bacterium]|nr:HlyD family efflux transporter periplasmic adaptor subunit [Gammaproteobacteria bacterium]